MRHTTLDKKSFLYDIIKNPFSYLLLLPAALYTFVFGYVTMPYIVIAFQRFNYRTGIFGSEWVGLKNFEFFFVSTRALMVTWNTLRLNFLFIVCTTTAAVIFSLLLNEVRHKKYLKVTQSSFLFPNFLSWIIVSYMVYGFFSTEYGLMNNILKAWGRDPVNWYTQPKYWTWILVVIRIWKDTGITSVIYLAAITAIDSELYEAATIDGASRWQQTKGITLPLLMPTVAILTLLAVGRIFYGDFGMIYALIGDNGLLYPTTDVIDTYVFRALRVTGDPAGAMAVGLYQSFIGFLLVFGANWLTRKLFPEGAIF